MKQRYRRLQQLERRVAALAASRPHKDCDDAWEAWYRGGCVGPLPPAGPRPVKYTPEEWQAQHRLLLALCCRSLGRPDPPGMTPQECREADETVAFFASIADGSEFSLREQAELAPYREVFAQFLSDTDGGSVPQASPCAESP